MALEGYPQTHLSPDVEVYAAVHETDKYEGPYASLKVLSSTNDHFAELHVFLTKAGFDSATTEGTDYYTVNAMVTDTVPGPLYGFRWVEGPTSGAKDASNVVAYKLSTDVL